MEERAHELDRRAAEIRPHLLGMTIEAARSEVAKHAAVSIRFTTDGIVTADYRPGRITAFVQEGIVTEWPDPPGPARQAAQNWGG